MVEGWVVVIVSVEWRRERWRVLRWERDARRALSGGERIELRSWDGAVLLLVVVRRGEGCPDRERRISWSMVDGGRVFGWRVWRGGR